MGLLNSADLLFGRGGRDKNLVTSDLHGRYFETARNGRLFMQTTTPVGLAIPIYTGTAPRVAIWNPPNSGVDAVLVSISAQRASGTTVEFAAGLFAAYGVDAVATGSFLTAFPGAINVAKTLPTNALLGSGQSSRVLSTASGTVTATAWAAGDHIYSLFHSYAAIGSSTPDGTPWTHDFDGKVIITPGTLVALAGSVASVALYATTLVWEEVDRA
ncbi:MAG: hypothetical protein NUW01_18185 [Gemmatimonadaceae bacterium]|nr:hypothetical protein [Gemmatimonadaceae bacterium]